MPVDLHPELPEQGVFFSRSRFHCRFMERQNHDLDFVSSCPGAIARGSYPHLQSWDSKSTSSVAPEGAAHDRNTSKTGALSSHWRPGSSFALEMSPTTWDPQLKIGICKSHETSLLLEHWLLGCLVLSCSSLSCSKLNGGPRAAGSLGFARNRSWV